MAPPGGGSETSGRAPQQQLRTATVESTSGGSASPLRKVTISPQTCPQTENTSLFPEQKHSVQKNALTQTALGEKQFVIQRTLCSAPECVLEREEAVFNHLSSVGNNKSREGSKWGCTSHFILFFSLITHTESRGCTSSRPRPRNIKRPNRGS